MATQKQLENIIKEICDSFPIEESELKQIAMNCGAKFKSIFASSAAKKYWEAKGQPMENLLEMLLVIQKVTPSMMLRKL